MKEISVTQIRFIIEILKEILRREGGTIGGESVPLSGPVDDE